EQAKERGAEPELADGVDTTLSVYVGQRVLDTAVCTQNELAELNISVEIAEHDLGAYYDTLGGGSNELLLLGWRTVTGDADYGLYALFHSKNHGAAGNRVFYDNAEVDELLDAGRAETDEDIRQEIYTEVEKILAEEAPSAFLNHSQYAVGYNDNALSNVELDPTGRIHLDNVRFK